MNPTFLLQIEGCAAAQLRQGTAHELGFEALRSVKAGKRITRAMWRRLDFSSYRAGCLLCGTVYSGDHFGRCLGWFDGHKCGGEA